MAPGNVGAAQFQLPHQLHILVASQRFKASGPAIGIGADAQIGAVDVAMTVTGLIVAVIADLRSLIERVMPVLDRHGAAHGVGAKPQLGYQPVVGHAAVGVRAGDPARTALKQHSRTASAGLADIARLDWQAHDRVTRDDLRRTIGATVEHHQHFHAFPSQQTMLAGTQRRVQAGVEQVLFVVCRNQDADHLKPSSAATERGSRLHTSRMKSAS